MTTTAPIVTRRSVDDPQVRLVFARLDAELEAAGDDDTVNFFALSADDVSEGDGALFLATLDGQPGACGAYRRIDEHAAEIKRMWVDPERRGLRLGRLILDTILTSALADGYSEIRLETGENLTAAVALYRSAGFAPCAAWGEYVGVASSYCMSRPLR